MAGAAAAAGAALAAGCGRRRVARIIWPFLLCLGLGQVCAQLNSESTRYAWEELQRLPQFSDVLLQPLRLTKQGVGGLRLCVPAPPALPSLARSYCCPAAPSGATGGARPYPGEPLVVKQSGRGWDLTQEACELPNLQPPGAPLGAAAQDSASVASWAVQNSVLASWPGDTLGAPRGNSTNLDWVAGEVTWEEVMDPDKLDPDMVEAIRLGLGQRQELLKIAMDAMQMLENGDMDKLLREALNSGGRIGDKVGGMADVLKQSRGEFEFLKRVVQRFLIFAFFAALLLTFLYRQGRSQKYKVEALSADTMRGAPIHSTFLGLSCCWLACCCRGRHWRYFNASVPQAVPAARTRRIGEWARSTYFWAMADVNTARVRWPLLAAFVVCWFLERYQGIYNFLIGDFIFEDDVTTGFDLAADFNKVVRYILFVIGGLLVVAIMRVFLAGNSTVHHPLWLMVTAFGIAIHGAINYIGGVWLIRNGLPHAEPIFTLWFNDIAWVFLIFGASFILFFEHRNGIGGHLAEVEQQSEHYLHDRVNQKSPSHVKCKLCDRQLQDLYSVRQAHWKKYHVCLGQIPSDWTTDINEDDCDNGSDVGMQDVKEWFAAKWTRKACSGTSDGSPGQMPLCPQSVAQAEELGQNLLHTSKPSPIPEVAGAAVDVCLPEDVRLPDIVEFRPSEKIGVRLSESLGLRPSQPLRRSFKGRGSKIQPSIKEEGSKSISARFGISNLGFSFLSGRTGVSRNSVVDAAGRAKVPVFYSTLVLIALLVPLLRLIPSSFTHIGNTIDNRAAIDKMLRLSGNCSVWSEVLDNKHQADCLVETCRHLVNKSEVNITAGAATHNFMEKFMEVNGAEAVLRLASAVRLCGRAQEREIPPIIASCGTGLSNIANGLAVGRGDIYSKAYEQAQWISAGDFSQAPPVDMEDVGAVFAAYTKETYWPYMNRVVEILTNSSLIARAQRAAMAEVLAEKHHLGGPGLQFWHRFSRQELENVGSVAAMSSGNAGVWIDMLLHSVVPSAPAEWRDLARRAVNTATSSSDSLISDQTMKELSDIVQVKILPLYYWGAMTATVVSVLYTFWLLRQIAASYVDRLREAYTTKSSNPSNRAIEKDLTNFDATMFPGYVVSTMYVAWNVSYFLVFLPFLWFGARLIPGLKLGMDNAAWNALVPFLAMILVRMFIRRVIFNGCLMDTHGEMKHLPAYSFAFLGVVLANYVVAQYYGVARVIIAIIFLINSAVRVDLNVMPYAFDVAYRSFEGVVALASKEYNPTKRVMLKVLAGSQNIYTNWYIRESEDHGSNAEATLRSFRSQTVLSRRSKAKIRWDLALLLLQNPMLQLQRKKRLQADRASCDKEGEGGMLLNVRRMLWQQQQQQQEAASARSGGSPVASPRAGAAGAAAQEAEMTGRRRGISTDAAAVV